MARIMVDFAMVNVNLKIEEIDMKMLRVVDCGEWYARLKDELKIEIDRKMLRVDWKSVEIDMARIMVDLRLMWRC